MYIRDSGTPEAAQILDRLDAIFTKWQAKPITDEDMKSIYQDIEKILEEAKS